jgi:hypothetical protein
MGRMAILHERGCWPADPAAIEAAHELLHAHASGTWAVACDGDVDGLSAGAIAFEALVRLGAKPSVVLPGKGEHVHMDAMRARIRAMNAEALVVLDMGSRGEPILPGMPTLLCDHHAPVHGFPPGARVVSAFGHDPVASTSLLAFHLFRGVAPIEDLAWLAVLGALADAGTDPLPEVVQAMAKPLPRTATREAIALLNAPKRSAAHDVAAAWSVLRAATGPSDIAQGRVPGVEILRAARADVMAEVARCAKTRPIVGPRAVLIAFRSAARVHPLVAMRWASRFPDKIVIAANEGYLPGRVNFAMRSRAGLDLLAWLHGLGAPLPGESGHGHPGATGGSMEPADFQRLLLAMGFPAGAWKSEGPTEETSSRARATKVA